MRNTFFRALSASAAAGALALGLSVLAPTGASAASATERSAVPATTLDHSQPVEMQGRIVRRGGGFHGGGRHFGHRHGGRGRGFGGAAIGLGIAGAILGAGAAAAASGPYYRECWVERRWVDTPYGPEPRRVRVCN